MMLNFRNFVRIGEQIFQSKLYAGDLPTRVHRALCFREYLSMMWRELEIEVDYFTWDECVSGCQGSFDRVQAFLERSQQSAAR